MKLQYLFIPLSLGSAMALAGWIAFEPGYTESSAAAIRTMTDNKSDNKSDNKTDMAKGQYRPSVIVGESDIKLDPETGFALAAFPPTIPDREWHKNAWFVNDCLSCHETGVGDAPMIRHVGLPEIVFDSKCRSCHVLIPGEANYDTSVPEFDPETGFASWAFPPLMPNNDKHEQAWGNRNCMMCHEDGIQNAPIVKHVGLPQIALESKCRSCHVQVRSHETSPWPVYDLFDD